MAMVRNHFHGQFCSMIISLHAPRAPPLAPPPPSPSLPPSPPPAFSHMYNGENSSYTGGCQSTWIRSDTPDYVGAQDTGLWWDGSSSTGHFDSVLVQFTDIIGLGPYQLRPHDQIQRATLRYNVDETFSATARGATAQVHEISTAWNANSTTFRTFAGAQGLNEAEYRTPAITTALANRAGWFDIDVTASVRSWVNGVNTNNGWIWMPSPQALGGSGDGSQMRACSAPPDRRVNLVVLAAQQPPRPPSPPARPPPPPPPPSPPPSPPRAPFTVLQIRNAEHAWLRKVAPTTNYATATEVFWDGNSATDADFVLMRFDLSALSGMAPISRALFRYTVSNVGDQAEMHEFRRSWTASTVTYNSIPMPSTNWPFSQATIDTLWGPTVNDLAGNVATHSVDVTPSINRWLTGTPNHGWVFVPYFGNGCGIRTTAWATVAQQPALEVHFDAPPAPPSAPPAPPRSPPAPPPPAPPPSPPAKPVAPAICMNTCAYAFDSTCSDGGPGSELSYCAYGTDCLDCGPRPVLPPPSPAPPAFPGGVITCLDTCAPSPPFSGGTYYASNGICEDGGPGSSAAWCRLGTDCTDCGPRSTYRPPPPPPRAPQCSNGLPLDLVLVFDHSG
eukprot:jgi/Chrpa1/21809/Chrysochromulina_OHIO_Genome00025890-RA